MVGNKTCKVVPRMLEALTDGGWFVGVEGGVRSVLPGDPKDCRKAPAKKQTRTADQPDTNQMEMEDS